MSHAETLRSVARSIEVSWRDEDMTGWTDPIRAAAAEIERLRGALEWFAAGRVGTSSRCLVAQAVGIGHLARMSYPFDADDFNRCMLAIKQVSGVSPEAMRGTSEVWDRLIEQWDHIAALVERGDWREANALIREARNERAALSTSAEGE